MQSAPVASSASDSPYPKCVQSLDIMGEEALGGCEVLPVPSVFKHVPRRGARQQRGTHGRLTGQLGSKDEDSHSPPHSWCIRWTGPAEESLEADTLFTLQMCKLALVKGVGVTPRLLL